MLIIFLQSHSFVIWLDTAHQHGGILTMVTLRDFYSKYGEDLLLISSVIVAGLVLYLVQ